MPRNVNVGLYIGTKITSIFKNSISMAVESGTYLNASSFVREAIKEKLVREGYLQIKNDNEDGGKSL